MPDNRRISNSPQ